MSLRKINERTLSKKIMRHNASFFDVPFFTCSQCIRRMKRHKHQIQKKFERRNVPLALILINFFRFSLAGCINRKVHVIKSFALRQSLFNKMLKYIKIVLCKIRRIPYYKSILSFFAFIFAGILMLCWYGGEHYSLVFDVLISLGYIGTFFAGIFYVSGFTAIPATAALLIFARQQNPYVAVIVAGIGILLCDVVLFLSFRRLCNKKTSSTFFVKRLQKKVVHFLRKYKVRYGKQSRLLVDHYPFHTRKKFDWVLRKYLHRTCACFFIASPLPSEIGISWLAASKDTSAKKSVVIVFLSQVIGIVAIFLMGKML